MIKIFKNLKIYKYNKTKKYKKKIYIFNEKCNDKIILYVDNNNFYYKIQSCYITNFSWELLIKNLNNIKMWDSINNISINNNVEKIITKINKWLKKYYFNKKKEYSIIKLFINNPYRLYCFLFPWKKIYERFFKNKKKNIKKV